MKNNRLTPVIALSLIAAAGGCGGGATAMPPAGAQSLQRTHPSWWREAPAAARAGVYVAQANGAGDGLIFGYGRQNRGNDAPLCSIAGQKFEQTQIAVDRMGRVYLPQAESATITIYAAHCGKLLRAVSDFNGVDGAVAVSGKTFYAAGGTHVSACTAAGCFATLTDASIRQIESTAVDHSGNVWTSYYNQSFATSLIVWPGGAMPGRVVSGYVNQNTPGGLLFDRHDHLIAVQTLFTNVYLYDCDAPTATCTNTAIVPLKAGSAFGALNAKNTDIQITDYANDAVDVYAYPSFKYKYSYDNGLNPGYSVEGIAQTI